MKLLIITQAMNVEDPILGFFHDWVCAFAERFEYITVICLKKGKYDLPSNVRVLSLGKEEGVSRVTYLWRLFRYIWRCRSDYNAVFVHMNEEYVLLAGWLWKLLKKPVYLWRNHYRGSWLTDTVALFCRKVFCTSHRSYTARFTKTRIMPVGVDTSHFAPDEEKRISRSILSFGRFAPAKRIDILIEAIGILKKMGVEYTASIYGAPLPEHEAYRNSVIARSHELGLDKLVTFSGAVKHSDAPEIFASHSIFVNLSASGMYDKTLFEAAASGCSVLAVSEDFAGLVGTPAVEPIAEKIATRLEMLLRTPIANSVSIRAHSLETLAERVFNEIAV